MIFLLRNVLPLLFFIVLFPTKTFAQLKAYQFEEIDSLQKVENRKVMIFIHTDWCKYCQRTKSTTFKNDSIIEQINKQFYFIDLNAEEKRNIVFNNHVFKYKPTGINTGINELAEQLGTIDSKVSYPTLCFLNADNEIIFQYPQYITHADLMAILTRLK